MLGDDERWYSKVSKTFPRNFVLNHVIGSCRFVVVMSVRKGSWILTCVTWVVLGGTRTHSTGRWNLEGLPAPVRVARG